MKIAVGCHKGIIRIRASIVASRIQEHGIRTREHLKPLLLHLGLMCHKVRGCSRKLFLDFFLKRIVVFTFDPWVKCEHTCTTQVHGTGADPGRDPTPREGGGGGGGLYAPQNCRTEHLATLPTCGPLLILSPALRRWGPPRRQGLCSHLAHSPFAIHTPGGIPNCPPISWLPGHNMVFSVACDGTMHDGE